MYYYIAAILLAIFWYTNSSEPEVLGDRTYTPSNYYSPSYTNNGYYDNEIYDSDYISDPENPYDEGTGHYAGYEWAEENEVDSCDGNSNSFIEGCEEYVSQKEEAQAREDYEDEYGVEEY